MVAKEVTSWVLKQETIFAFMSAVIAFSWAMAVLLVRMANAEIRRKDRLLAESNNQMIATITLVNERLLRHEDGERELSEMVRGIHAHILKTSVIPPSNADT